MPESRRRHRTSPRDRLKMQGESQSWAVSYSDMLMVLLSFFIIFFSTQSGGRSQMILRLKAASKQMGIATTPSSVAQSSPFDGRQPASLSSSSPSANSVGNLAIGTGDGQGPYAGEAGAGKVASTAKIMTALKPLPSNVKVSETQEQITLYFPDNLYAPRKTSLSDENSEAFDQMIQVLNEQFQNQVKITIVGHTDQSAYHAHHSDSIQDNFDLSSIRASHASSRAVRDGFPAEYISAKGSASNDRNSRSLSVIIEARN
jgi:flagellar motor protein MotB